MTVVSSVAGGTIARDRTGPSWQQRLAGRWQAFRAGPRHLGGKWARPRRRPVGVVLLCQWLYALLVSQLTVAGGILLFCLGVLVPYALAGGPRLAAYIPVFAFLALGCVNIVAGFFVRPDIAVTRRLPARCAAGATVRCEYYVVNRARRRPAWDIRLDTLPLPAGLGFPNGRACLRTLGPGERATARAELGASRRGRFVLPAVRADTAFPFHLWRWGIYADEPRALIVHPAFTPLRHVNMAFGQRFQMGGVALVSKVGAAMEFVSCREYRTGDNPRHIHWPSWARTGTPVVKEFQEEYLCRTAVILDTHAHARRWLGQPAPRAFEAAVSLTAALTEYLARGEYVVELFAAGPCVYRFQGGRSLGYVEQMLDVLACLEPHPGEPFAELSPSIMAEIAGISSAMLILLTWNEARRNLIAALRAAGVAVKTVLVTDGDTPPPADLPEGTQLLAATDIVAGKCLTL